MFIVLACMLAGIAVGFALRSRKIHFIHGFILTLIWVLLFLLGLEVGANETIVRQFPKLGFQAFLLASGGTLGSVVAAKLLWMSVKHKSQNR